MQARAEAAVRPWMLAPARCLRSRGPSALLRAAAPAVASVTHRSGRVVRPFSTGEADVLHLGLLPRVAQALAAVPGDALSVTGWVRSARFQKQFSFLELNDGSGPTSLQVVWPTDSLPLTLAEKASMGTGSCICVDGRMVASPKPGQRVELQASRIQLVGPCDAATYPLQKKAHTDEFLREIPHLRARSAKTAAMLRVRHVLAQALQQTLWDRGYISVNTPILTANDCEGAGELFAVEPASALGAPASSATAGQQPMMGGGTTVDATGEASSPGFFGPRRVYLTVSGQLQLEAFACSMGRVYTFGPTFRAENSNTTRHASEFWMLEPEIAPGTMADAMDLAEACVKSACSAVLTQAAADVAWLGRAVDPDLASRLEATSNGARPFRRMTYTEAVAVLRSCGHQFRSQVQWEAGLATEHERYLAEVFARGPVFVTDYPATIKPFYMRQNAADDAGCPAATVQGFDLLVPRIGELAGGSAREERYELLAPLMARQGLLSPALASRVLLGDGANSGGTGVRASPYDAAAAATPNLDWYLDTRRFGSVPHAGWGLGFERLVMYATGIDNIRDALPCPRVPGSCRM